MKQLVAGHRAGLGISGVAALAALFVALRCPGTSLAIELALAAVAAAGIAGLLGSPYWSIVYRESPLRRAAGGTSDLDERELALRDRASGLTYYLFVALNIAALALCAALVELGKLAVDRSALTAAIVPYGWCALALPVILLEWFEPSQRRAASIDEEEEG